VLGASQIGFIGFCIRLSNRGVEHRGFLAGLYNEPNEGFRFSLTSFRSSALGENLPLNTALVKSSYTPTGSSSPSHAVESLPLIAI
jgi:hypothetical protein